MFAGIEELDMTDRRTRLRNAVVRVIQQSDGGTPANSVIKVVSKSERAGPDEVRREVRLLLENGTVSVGGGLKLVANVQASAS